LEEKSSVEKITSRRQNQAQQEIPVWNKRIFGLRRIHQANRKAPKLLEKKSSVDNQIRIG